MQQPSHCTLQPTHATKIRFRRGGGVQLRHHATPVHGGEDNNAFHPSRKHCVQSAYLVRLAWECVVCVVHVACMVVVRSTHGLNGVYLNAMQTRPTQHNTHTMHSTLITFATCIMQNYTTHAHDTHH